MFGDILNYELEFEFDHVSLIQEGINLCLFKFIVVIFDVNHEYIMLDDYFGSNYHDVDVLLIGHELEFS